MKLKNKMCEVLSREKLISQMRYFMIVSFYFEILGRFLIISVHLWYFHQKSGCFLVLSNQIREVLFVDTFDTVQLAKNVDTVERFLVLFTL